MENQKQGRSVSNTINLPFWTDTTGYQIRVNFLPEEDGIVVAVGEYDDIGCRSVAYGSGKDQAEAQSDLIAKIDRIKKFTSQA